MKDFYEDTLKVGDYVLVLPEHGGGIHGGAVAKITAEPDMWNRKKAKIWVISLDKEVRYPTRSLIKKNIEDLI